MTDVALDFYTRGPDRPWINARLTSASIIGHTTHNEARLWVRVWAPGKYALLLSTEAIPQGSSAERPKLVGGEKPRAVLATPNADDKVLQGEVAVKDFGHDSDLTGVFELKSLQPDTTYRYALFPIDEGAGHNPWELPPDEIHRRFRTQTEGRHDLCFGLISCHMPFAKNGDIINTDMWERLYRMLDEHGGQMLVAAGDQAYVDGNADISIWRQLRSVKRELLKLPAGQRAEVMKSWYRDIYRGYWGFPWLQKTLARFPTYMIWDDHEIMDGWGSYTKKELADELGLWWELSGPKELALAFEMFEAAKAVYWEYEHSHNPSTPSGVYDYGYSVRDCAFYVLDMRGKRDFNRKTYKILGKDQIERFEAWVRSSDQARALFVVSPVPVIHASDFVVNKADLALFGLADDLRDEWEHETNWEERNVILKMVFEYSEKTGKAVAFLSGDVHIGAAFRIRNDNWKAARVYQLTSSSITHPGFPGLELIIRDAGEVGNKKSAPAADRYQYEKLDSFGRNNFGIVTVKEGTVHWDLYGQSHDGRDLIKRKRIEL
jgi:alkaline phosphatase D